MGARDERKERQYSRLNPEDQRNEFQIDRDRLIYSFAFRRLAQVTQVASANEGNIFHNRLTHSLKVGQVGRRLAEYLKLTSGCDLPNLSPDVVETACLAHDLGHPPFGHIAEKELDILAINAGLSDGFEGNAQTFRILTKLEPHKSEYLGLNLTRATLNATLKYPWYRARDNSGKLKNSKKARKFSVYDLDRDAFNFVILDDSERELGRQTLEASIMEFADDITYSIHDLEDFYLAGLIPLDTLIGNLDEWNRFIEDWIDISDREIKSIIATSEEQARLKEFLSSFLPPKYSPGSIEEITYVRRNSSLSIQRYIQSASITNNYGKYGYLNRPQSEDIELKLLQRIVWRYVITNPKLAIRHYGQKRVIRELFSIYREAIETNQNNLIPSRFLKDNSLKYLLAEDKELQKIRLAVDIVASLSESEAILMYRRLTGLEQALSDPIG